MPAHGGSKKTAARLAVATADKGTGVFFGDMRHDAGLVWLHLRCGGPRDAGDADLNSGASSDTLTYGYTNNNQLTLPRRSLGSPAAIRDHMPCIHKPEAQAKA